MGCVGIGKASASTDLARGPALSDNGRSKS